MNLQPIDHPREGQQIQCSTCRKMFPVLTGCADLDAPAGTFYCKRCAPGPFADNPYPQFVAAGCEIDHHESDLYVKGTPEAVKIARDSAWTWSEFRSAIDGTLWLEFPFAYAPFWEAKP